MPEREERDLPWAPLATAGLPVLLRSGLPSCSQLWGDGHGPPEPCGGGEQPSRFKVLGRKCAKLKIQDNILPIFPTSRLLMTQCPFCRGLHSGGGLQGARTDRAESSLHCTGETKDHFYLVRPLEHHSQTPPPQKMRNTKLLSVCQKMTETTPGSKFSFSS